MKVITVTSEEMNAAVQCASVNPSIFMETMMFPPVSQGNPKNPDEQFVIAGTTPSLVAIADLFLSIDGADVPEPHMTNGNSLADKFVQSLEPKDIEKLPSRLQARVKGRLAELQIRTLIGDINNDDRPTDERI